MSAKWTPGPYERSGCSVYALEDAGHRMKTNRFYAHLDRSGSQATPEELEAVAQLWVTAPELYEALYNVVYWSQQVQDTFGNRDANDKAINNQIAAEKVAMQVLSRARGEAS